MSDLTGPAVPERRHGVLVPTWQRDVWRELTAPLQSALDEVSTLVADARERGAAAAYVLTREDKRDTLFEIVEPERQPRFTIGLDAAFERDEYVVVVECDPPCYACRIG